MGNLITRRRALSGAAASAAALTLATSSTATTSPVVHEVRINRFKFKPAKLQVRVGDTIRWINDDLAPHTATADEFGWDTGEIPGGGNSEVVIETGMENSYFCAFHPHMKGTFEIS